MIIGMRSQFPHGDRDSDPAEEEAWDAHDPRRQKDPYAPPAEPCECVCHHCRRTFLSDQMWFQKINGARDGLSGFWKCPTPNCSGGGFTMDIFPVDPTHPANEGWFDTDDDEDEFDESYWEDCEEPDYSQDMEFDDMEWEEVDEPDAEYDPAEPQYQMMDQWACDDDLEGEGLRRTDRHQRDGGNEDKHSHGGLPYPIWE